MLRSPVPLRTLPAQSDRGDHHLSFLRLNCFVLGYLGNESRATLTAGASAHLDQVRRMSSLGLLSTNEYPPHIIDSKCRFDNLHESTVARDESFLRISLASMAEAWRPLLGFASQGMLADYQVRYCLGESESCQYSLQMTPSWSKLKRDESTFVGVSG